MRRRALIFPIVLAVTSLTGEAFASGHHFSGGINSGNTYIGNRNYASITQISNGGNTNVNNGGHVQGGNTVNQTAVIIQNSPITLVGGP